jgi:hypothetical protein
VRDATRAAIEGLAALGAASPAPAHPRTVKALDELERLVAKFPGCDAAQLAKIRGVGINTTRELLVTLEAAGRVTKGDARPSPLSGKSMPTWRIPEVPAHGFAVRGVEERGDVLVVKLEAR